MKLKKSFLEKVIKEEIVDTRKYRYKTYEYTAVNENDEFYKFWIIKRIDIDYVDTTRYLDEIFWEPIAQTTDRKNFIKFK